MPEIEYRNRRAVALDNEHVQVIVTVEGGHLAAIVDKASGVSPLWSPPWPSIEPSRYELSRYPVYGSDAESKLLAGIMGHNLCLDIFGAPSAEEASAGLTTHGEASVVPYNITVSGDTMTQQATFPAAQLAFERTLQLKSGSRTINITETVENLTATDRPIGWTQHVTLGPPYLEKGKTVFRASATRSMVIETDFTHGKGYMKTGAVFDWPNVPTPDGKTVDMQVFINLPVSGAYTAHLMDPHRDDAGFLAWSPTHKLALSYRWRRADFPWLGIWEENYGRTTTPWSGKGLTRGMEFGASPFPENRRQMIERGSLFGVPGFRWIPAKTKVRAAYSATFEPLGAAPTSFPTY
jgi:hypothetical protein